VRQTSNSGVVVVVVVVGVRGGDEGAENEWLCPRNVTVDDKKKKKTGRKIKNFAPVYIGVTNIGRIVTLSICSVH